MQISEEEERAASSNISKARKTPFMAAIASGILFLFLCSPPSNEK